MSHHLILKLARSDEGYSDHSLPAHGNADLPLEDSCFPKLEEESKNCLWYLWRPAAGLKLIKMKDFVPTSEEMDVKYIKYKRYTYH